MKGQDIISVSSSQKSGGKNHAEGISLSFEGFDELIKAFNDLGDEDLVFRLSEPSVKAAEIIAEKAKSKINNNSWDLSNSIIVRRPGRQKGKAYQIFARVGFSQKNMSGNGGNGYYGSAVELGHNIVTKSGSIVGDAEAKPFLRPAADECREKVADIITEAMEDIIWEVWNK